MHVTGFPGNLCFIVSSSFRNVPLPKQKLQGDPYLIPVQY